MGWRMFGRTAGIGAVIVVALALASAVVVPAAGAAVFPVTPTTLATDGYVAAMTSLNGQVYLTGDFHQIGRFAGSGVALDPTTGTVEQNFPQINGQISFVLTAPGGGWYVGGDFTEVGGVPRAGLAEIDPDGTLDATFDPTVNGLVDALALDGSSLYLGGSFTLVDGVERQGLAAVDTTTGALLPFDARETGTATELYFLPANGTNPAVLYAGMGQVLALDPVTGDPIPGFNSEIEAEIDALAADGNLLYVGGAGGMVALNAMTGAIDSDFNVTPLSLTGQPDFNGTVYSIVVQPTRLLVGGSFNALGGSQGPLVALNPVTGQSDRSFRPQVVGSIYDMDQTGNTLWVGGSVTSADGGPAGNVVALDATSGARDPAVSPNFNGQVNGIRVGSGSVFAGGQFDMVNPLVTHGFAQVQGSTGALDSSFVPPAPRTQILSSGDGVIVSSDRQFQGYDPTSRKHPYSPSYSTVQVLSPLTGRPFTGRGLHVLHGIKDLNGVAVGGGSLFVDQRAGEHQRFTPNVMTVRSLRTGRIQHQYHLPLPGYVSELDWVGGRLYVAGSFKRVRANGQQANLAILDLDPATGRLDSGFDPHANGPIYALAAHAAELYFAGLFHIVQGLPRNGLAAVSLSDGHVDTGFHSIIPGDNLTTLTPVLDDVFLQSPFHVNFLSLGTGAVDPFLAPESLKAGSVTALAATGSDAVVSAEIDTPLLGYSDDTLNFVRTVG